MNRCHTSLRIMFAASLAVVLVGCQTNKAYRWRTSYERPAIALQQRRCESQQPTIQPGYSVDGSISDGYLPTDPGANINILPGHSTGSPDAYVPSPAAEPMYPAPPAPGPTRQFDKLSPQVNPDIPDSQAPAPVIEEDVRLRNAPAGAQDQLIRRGEEPDLLSPFSVRSIYKKLHPRTPEKKPVEDGPIAGRRRLDASTRVCEYSNVLDVSGLQQPVTLGLPETNDVGISQQLTERTPAVMQASPSSFRHPLLADPTGVQYGTQ